MAKREFKVINSFFRIEKSCGSERQADNVILIWQRELLRLHREEYPGNRFSFKEVKLPADRTEYFLEQNGEEEGMYLAKFPTY